MRLRPQDCVRTDVFCAGLVTDFGSVGEGINQQAWLGLQDAKAANLAERIDYIETVDTRDRAANIDVLAKDGYDVIVTTGAGLAEDTSAAAKKYPKILFIGVEQPQTSRILNLAGLVFHEDQSGFLAGALAAMMTQTDQAGAVCEERFIDPMRRYCDGFQAGAKYVNPDVKVIVDYRAGSPDNLFNDTDWGRNSAVQLVNQGADVVFAAGGGTADAALEAAASGGSFVIGTETDVYARLPNIRSVLLTSAMNDVRSGTLDLLRLARQGQFPSGEFPGQVSLAPFHDLDREIPQSIKVRLSGIQKGLADGSISTGIPYKSP